MSPVSGGGAVDSPSGAGGRIGRVVLFTGPSGAGKTTVGEAWAGSRATPTAFIDHDLIRFHLRSGYVSRSDAHRDATLRTGADQQWLMAAAVCEAMVDTYATWGVDVALAAFRPPGNWRGCWAGLDAMRPVVVVLLPSLDVCLARDSLREGRMRGGEETVRRSYRFDWATWGDHPDVVLLDTSSMEVEQVIARVEDALRSTPSHD